MNQFSYVLSKKTYFKIADAHLWFSIFSRPPSAKFARTQRCTCCFVLLFSSMLLNIMYYDLVAESKTATGGLILGPFMITPQQIGIGFMVQLFSLVPSLLIVQFFRRIRPRKQILPLQKALNELRATKTVLDNVKSHQAKKKDSSFGFPWWCLYIVYTLSFVIIGVSIFFIMVRGIEFGDTKTQQWLTSILSGFFSSVLITEPLKIIGLTIILLFFCRNRTDEKEEKEYIDEIDLEFDENQQENIDSSLVTSLSTKQVNRLEKNEIDYAREQRLKEVRMWSILREFGICLLFLFLILSMTYANREENSYFQVAHFRNFFFDSETKFDYRRIFTIDDYWKWLQNSFVENVRAQNWYNDDLPKYLNGYLNDKTNRLIGWATMRQLRIKSELCSDQRLIRTCRKSYNYFNEEKESFYPGWKVNKTTDDEEEEYSSSIIKSFQYSDSDDLDTYVYVGEHATYSGNGYVYEFRGSLSQLKSNLSKLYELEWIDERTRAVIIQMTLYNPNVQLFTSVTMLVEFLSTGSIHPSARFEPLNFYAFSSIFQLVCTILYMLLIIYLMRKEFQRFIQIKFKYFRQFWSVVQLGIIVCSWLSLAIYIWHLKETNRISDLFAETNGYVYVNLQLSVYVNDFLTFLLGFCCFFGMIKLIDVISFNPRLRLFTSTLNCSMKELAGFGMMFSIIFLSFLSLFYLLFVSKMLDCANMLSTAQMLFEITLMKFNASEIVGADALLGPLCFTLFIFVAVFVCFSMFLSIINDNFRLAREMNSNEEDRMLSFMWKRFLHWTRLRRPTQDEIQEERDVQMRSQYCDPIENFPHQIDQLFEQLDKVEVTCENLIYLLFVIRFMKIKKKKCIT